MISPPSAQEGTISRRLEHKSFIYKPLESKTLFLALSDGMVAWLFSEGSSASQCPGSGPLPVCPFPASPRPLRTELGALNSRVSGPLFIPPTLHQTVLRAATEPPRSHAVVPSLANEGTTARLRGGCGAARRTVWRRVGGIGGQKRGCLGSGSVATATIYATNRRSSANAVICESYQLNLGYTS